MSLRTLFAVALILGCGNNAPPRSGDAGSGGSATGGANTGGTSGDGVGGTGAGGSGVQGGTSGDAGGPSDDWNAACGTLTHNGRCDGDVYEWCDYFTRGIARMDCAVRGMTCAALDPVPNEEDTNGCVALGDCLPTDVGCDGNVVLNCYSDGLHAVDCRKNKGPTSTCLGDRCARSMSCSTPGTTCDGSMAVVCDEEGQVYLQNCQQRDLAGVCVEETPGAANCDPPLSGG